MSVTCFKVFFLICVLFYIYFLIPLMVHGRIFGFRIYRIICILFGRSYFLCSNCLLKKKTVLWHMISFLFLLEADLANLSVFFFTFLFSVSRNLSPILIFVAFLTCYWACIYIYSLHTFLLANTDGMIYYSACL